MLENIQHIIRRKEQTILNGDIQKGQVITMDGTATARV